MNVIVFMSFNINKDKQLDIVAYVMRSSSLFNFIVAYVMRSSSLFNLMPSSAALHHFLLQLLTICDLVPVYLGLYLHDSIRLAWTSISDLSAAICLVS